MENENAGERPGGSMRGRVAAYAWGADYHEVLDERLKRLVEFIEGKTGRPVANRRYTDSGPLLERELAQRAGLGWIGKNTCLINPEMGSYFLLAEVLLDLELDPTRPSRPTAADLARAAWKPARRTASCPTAPWTPAAASPT